MAGTIGLFSPAARQFALPGNRDVEWQGDVCGAAAVYSGKKISSSSVDSQW